MNIFKKNKILKFITLATTIVIPFATCISVASCGTEIKPVDSILDKEQEKLSDYLNSQVKSNASYIYGEYLGVATTSLLNIMSPNYILANNNDSGWVQKKGDHARVPLYKINVFNNFLQKSIKNIKFVWPDYSDYPPEWSNIKIPDLYNLEQVTLSGTSDNNITSNSTELIRNVNNAISKLSDSHVAEMLKLFSFKDISFSAVQKDFINNVKQSSDYNFDSQASYVYGQLLGSAIAFIVNDFGLKNNIAIDQTKNGWFTSVGAKKRTPLNELSDYNNIISKWKYAKLKNINSISQNDLDTLKTLFKICLTGTGSGATIVNPQGVEKSNNLINSIEANISSLSDTTIQTLELVSSLQN